MVPLLVICFDEGRNGAKVWIYDAVMPRAKCEPQFFWLIHKTKRNFKEREIDLCLAALNRD
jgi:hypothetical protein